MDLIASREGRLGRILLNRPQALNTLTLPMVREFRRALDDFERDASICAVLVTGAGERGLCAGGDVRILYELEPSQKGLFADFWREEYALNARIASFPKPYVAIMDGVVMGGGVGISAHGNRRVVTERSRVAMPEVGIGFLPDVGATWLLSRAREIGAYLALSATSVAAADAIEVGLADVLIHAADIEPLIDRLATIADAEDVDVALRRLARRPGSGRLSLHRPLLAETTAHDQVDDIIAAFEREGSEFSLRAAEDISAKSPTALKVTRALLLRAIAAPDLETCLTNEFRAACRMLETHDLYEGIRAAIIDKDRRPTWSPDGLDSVSDQTVEGILAGDDTPLPAFKSWDSTPYSAWRG
ncbi:3-hydroxyisobutyryl-CoA hydrolase [Methylocystis sp. SB2]|uniref:3-hydroxyisobutyryl-CoA hydrolase n=1 Tax=Methylocystis sp. (strain SB2) TaxID=743836 RepID=UPI000428EDEE|nr:3-hydroxyisobutyryl-CoA hydrolase [Methylocystis sp. SB2]ULO23229.1 3-hydroxyisobutyryl-CoA hydrolase [Methylocystis sp. SB2]